MKLYTINASPVQSLEQMLDAGYDINETNTVEHINDLHIREYPVAVAKKLAEWGIDGFTIYQVQGYWKAISEVSFQIRIALESSVVEDNLGQMDIVHNICEELRIMYNQDSVMLTRPDNSVEFI